MNDVGCNVKAVQLHKSKNFASFIVLNGMIFSLLDDTVSMIKKKQNVLPNGGCVSRSIFFVHQHII